jgi:hypothetical protein
MSKVIDVIVVDKRLMLQIIEASVAHHREEKSGYGDVSKRFPTLPKMHKAVLDDVVSIIDISDEMGRIVTQTGVIGFEYILIRLRLSNLDVVHQFLGIFVISHLQTIGLQVTKVDNN